MSNRTIVLLCIGVVTVVLIACAGLLTLPFLMLPRLGVPVRRSTPPELQQPAIVMGAGELQKRVFLNDPSLGLVTGILVQEAPAASVGIAGDRGAVWATHEGTVTSSTSILSDVTYV